VKGTVCFVISLIIIFICSINGCGDNLHEMSECMPGSLEVISDCSDANAVLCTCTRVDNQTIHPNGKVSNNTYCDSECKPYGK
jgi:hypothetical protein